MSEQVERRRTLGRPTIVTAMQTLVDEPLEAVVAVSHPGYLWRMLGCLAVGILVADLLPAGRSGALSHAAILVAVTLVLWAGSGAVLDARSPLTFGLWAGSLAVSDSTVYIARNSFWTSRPVALTTSFPRVDSTIVLGRTGWARRALTVSVPGFGPLALDAPLAIIHGDARDAISSLGRPPEAEWRPDAGNPGWLRWWDGGELTQITTREP